MKKTYIIIASVVLLLIIAAVFLAIFGESKKIIPDDPGSEYSYYYQKDGKNITVIIEGGFPEGYVWSEEDSESKTAYTKAGTSKSNKAEFSVVPVKEGRYTVTFVLKKDGIPEDRIYEITMNFNIDNSGNIGFSSSSHKKLDGSKTYNKDGYDYVIAFGSGNELDVCIKNSKNKSFDFAVDNKIVKAEQITYTDEEVNDAVIAISPIGLGDCSAYIVDMENNKAIKLGLNVNKEGIISVRTNEVVDYDGKKVIEDEDFSKAESIVGKIVFPEGAERTGCSIKGYRVSSDSSFIGIDIEITSEANVFDYIIFPENGTDMVSSYYASNGETKTNVTILGLDGVCFVSEYYTTVVWSEGKNAFAVTVPSADTEEAVHTAEEFVGIVEAK